MAGKRKPYVPPISIFEDDEYFVDRLSLSGTKAFKVLETAEPNPQVKVVQVSRGMPDRKPIWLDEKKAFRKAIKEFEPTIYPAQVGKKWCCNCDNWVNLDGFSPKATSRDGLQSHCKGCRAEHARMIYWAAKHTAPQIVAMPKAA